MGILKNLTKEYFGEIERTEDELPMLDTLPEGVGIHDFTDMSGKRHKNGYYIIIKEDDDEYSVNSILNRLIGNLIDLRGNDCNLNDVDVSNVEYMGGIFQFTDFCGDVSGWNTSNCKYMYRMFYNCNKFNCNLDKWDVSNVTIFTEMFKDCHKFNGNVDNWKFNTEDEVYMTGMFQNCLDFDRDISKWDVSNVVHTAEMFYGCSSFCKDLSNWEFSDKFVTSSLMFTKCPKMKKEFYPKGLKE